MTLRLQSPKRSMIPALPVIGRWPSDIGLVYKWLLRKPVAKTHDRQGFSSTWSLLFRGPGRVVLGDNVSR